MIAAAIGRGEPPEPPALEPKPGATLVGLAVATGSCTPEAGDASGAPEPLEASEINAAVADSEAAGPFELLDALAVGLGVVFVPDAGVGAGAAVGAGVGVGVGAGAAVGVGVGVGVALIGPRAVRFRRAWPVSCRCLLGLRRRMLSCPSGHSTFVCHRRLDATGTASQRQLNRAVLGCV
jgi:hypothetical protein